MRELLRKAMCVVRNLQNDAERQLDESKARFSFGCDEAKDGDEASEFSDLIASCLNVANQFYASDEHARERTHEAIDAVELKYRGSGADVPSTVLVCAPLTATINNQAENLETLTDYDGELKMKAVYLEVCSRRNEMKSPRLLVDLRDLHDHLVKPVTAICDALHNYYFLINRVRSRVRIRRLQCTRARSTQNESSNEHHITSFLSSIASFAAKSLDRLSRRRASVHRK